MLNKRKIVMDILIKDKQSRNDDYRLYIKVLTLLAKDVLCVSVEEFFTSPQIKATVPTIEYVSRCRRDLQSKFPELKADISVREKRNILRKKYKETFIR